MIKRSWLSLSLLFAVICCDKTFTSEGSNDAGVPVATDLAMTSNSSVDLAEVASKSDSAEITILPIGENVTAASDISLENVVEQVFAHGENAVDVSDKVSRFAALSNKLKELPGLLQTNLVKGYDASLGRMYNPDSLKDRNNLKAALFVTASAATIYACYLVWKKYFASKQEEDEEEAMTRAFCAAARNNKR